VAAPVGQGGWPELAERSGAERSGAWARTASLPGRHRGPDRQALAGAGGRPAAQCGPCVYSGV